MTENTDRANGHGVRLVFHGAPRSEAAPVLLIMLTGVDIRAEDFVVQDFVATLAAGAAAVDLLIAEPALDDYLDGSIAERLVAMLSEQPLARYRRVWLGGISLGAFGALLVASAERFPVDGVVLLAPFLGVPGLIAEVERAGGLAAWQPGPVAANDGERRVLAWLKSHIAAGRPRPVLQLAYGARDRFGPGARLLAACLPAGQVHVEEGGHDWPTWTKLWRRIVDAQPFVAA
ncbi:MAG TPA: hypothetical protein VGP48_14890 [Stellaceae bacterium]|jgi:hypothetical protein|nr:hypothetical protein [Stellaceae bacterium]